MSVVDIFEGASKIDWRVPELTEEQKIKIQHCESMRTDLPKLTKSDRITLKNLLVQRACNENPMGLEELAFLLTSLAFLNG